MHFRTFRQTELTCLDGRTPLLLQDRWNLGGNGAIAYPDFCIYKIEKMTLVLPWLEHVKAPTDNPGFCLLHNEHFLESDL